MNFCVAHENRTIFRSYHIGILLYDLILSYRIIIDAIDSDGVGIVCRGFFSRVEFFPRSHKIMTYFNDIDP